MWSDVLTAKAPVGSVVTLLQQSAGTSGGADGKHGYVLQMHWNKNYIGNKK